MHFRHLRTNDAPLARTLLALLLALLTASPTPAWYDAGHKIIASVAFRRLGEEERARVIEILERHPRFQDDFAAQLPEEIEPGDRSARAEWLLQQAAVWPDLARVFRREERTRFHRSTWHYIDIPRFLTEADRELLEPRLRTNRLLEPPPPEEPEALLEMNIVQSIRHARRRLAVPDCPAEERAVLLCWLLHNIGDLHQPMHVGSLYSQKSFAEGDRGGNLIRTAQRGNLHAAWDGLLGARLSWKEARNRALTLLASEEFQQLGAAAERELEEAAWLAESRALADSAAYDPTVLAYLRLLEQGEGGEETAPLDLPEAYLRRAGGIAEIRAVQAAHRLAAVLREVAAR